MIIWVSHVTHVNESCHRLKNGGLMTTEVGLSLGWESTRERGGGREKERDRETDN